MIAYNKDKVRPGEITSYEQLADAKWKGRVCMRSSTSIYNLSLMGALIDHLGAEKAEQWAKGVRENLAQEPKGGDTDQLKAVAAGQCDVTISNQYYYARLARSQKPDEKQVAEKIAIVFPNQNSWGTHVNISGAGVLKNAPHRENAVKFLEYLASDEAQRYFADGNNEWPVVRGVKVDNPVLNALGDFKADRLNAWLRSAGTSRTRRKFTTAWPGSNASRRRSAAAAPPPRSRATGWPLRPGARPSPGCKPRPRACRS